MLVRRLRAIIMNLRDRRFVVLRKETNLGSVVMLPGTDVEEPENAALPFASERPIGILMPLVHDCIGGALDLRLGADGYVTPRIGMVSDGIGLVPATATDKKVMSVEESYYFFEVTEYSALKFANKSTAEGIAELVWVNKQEMIEYAKKHNAYLGKGALGAIEHFNL